MLAWICIQAISLIKEVLAGTVKTARVVRSALEMFYSSYHLNSCKHTSTLVLPPWEISLGLKRYRLLEVPVIPEQVGGWWGALQSLICKEFGDVLSMKVIIRKQILFYHILLVSNYYVLASEELTALSCRKRAHRCFPHRNLQVPYFWLQNSDSDPVFDSGSYLPSQRARIHDDLHHPKVS